MDLITFIVIAAVVYSLFSKKDKKPERQSGAPPSREEARPEAKKGLMESLTELLEEAVGQLETKESPTKEPPMREQRKTSSAPKDKKTSKQSSSKKRRTDPATSSTARRGVSPNEAQTRLERKLLEQKRRGGLSERELERFDRVSERVNREAEPLPQASITAPAQVTTRPTTNFRLDRETVVQGIIWSQVLSEPRSRRPRDKIVRPY